MALVRGPFFAPGPRVARAAGLHRPRLSPQGGALTLVPPGGELSLRAAQTPHRRWDAASVAPPRCEVCLVRISRVPSLCISSHNLAGSYIFGFGSRQAQCSV